MCGIANFAVNGPPYGPDASDPNRPGAAMRSPAP